FAGNEKSQGGPCGAAHFHAISKSSQRGRLISSSKRSKVQGHEAMLPCLSIYQLLQPVAQTVPGSAARTSALNRSAASRFGAISEILPCASRSISRSA